MANIYVHGRQIESVFELLGTKENDITYSIGWALANCPAFLKRFLSEILPKLPDIEITELSLQEHQPNRGITDIEIRGTGVHIIVEAKRGWNLPSERQLGLYATRLGANGPDRDIIVCMSECSQEFAALNLRKPKSGILIRHVSWKEMARFSLSVEGASHAEKRLLHQLRTYLQRIVKMQNQESNMVFIVSLGWGMPDESSISWIDIVEKKRRYFHPANKDWPKEPPNYIGFRYGGALQSIHHVESYKIVNDLHSEIKELCPGFGKGPHFCYTLGPAVIPPHKVVPGKVYPSGHKWAMLDLLLTCESVSEACDETKKRREAES